VGHIINTNKKKIYEYISSDRAQSVRNDSGFVGSYPPFIGFATVIDEKAFPGGGK
jgi:hypothetical protein